MTTTLHLLAATSQKQSGNPIVYLLPLLAGAFYFFIYRPQQKRQLAQRQAVRSYEIGDEVLTAGGIIGRVLDIQDDRVTIETSVGATFTVLAPYVLKKLEETTPAPDVVDGETAATVGSDPGGSPSPDEDGPATLGDHGTGGPAAEHGDVPDAGKPTDSGGPEPHDGEHP